MLISTCVAAFSFGAFIDTGAGCMTATVVRSDASHVVLQYGPWDTKDELRRLADSFCRNHGKLAHLNGDEPDQAEPLFRVATFNCVKGSPRPA